jgi:hypothetical protein
VSSWLAPSDALFGDASRVTAEQRKLMAYPVEDAALGGRKARTYERGYEHHNKTHMPRPVQMRLRDVVVQTAGSYYVIEYRATQKLWEKHKPAFERFLRSFKFGPSA